MISTTVPDEEQEEVDGGDEEGKVRVRVGSLMKTLNVTQRWIPITSVPQSKIHLKLRSLPLLLL